MLLRHAWLHCIARRKNVFGPVRVLHYRWTFVRCRRFASKISPFAVGVSAVIVMFWEGYPGCSGMEVACSAWLHCYGRACLRVCVCACSHREISSMEDFLHDWGSHESLSDSIMGVWFLLCFCFSLFCSDSLGYTPGSFTKVGFMFHPRRFTLHLEFVIFSRSSWVLWTS